MDDIFVLTKTVKSFFGDEPKRLEIIGWTDSRQTAADWRNSSNMLEIKECKTISKVT